MYSESFLNYICAQHYILTLFFFFESTEETENKEDDEEKRSKSMQTLIRFFLVKLF